MSMSSAFLQQFRKALGLLLPDYTGAIKGGAITGTTATLTGDIAADGGFRKELGPFAAPGIAAVTAASQTNLDLRYEHVAAFVSGFVAKRAGSIMGLSGQLDTAPTTAGAAAVITAKVTVNGTEVGAALNIAFSSATADVKKWAVTTKDSVAFAAGDVISVSYTTDANLSNTPKLVCSIEIEG